jgi:predicted Zn-dependent peptidase
VIFGDYTKAFSIDKEYQAVTAADIQRVAKKYFTEKNRTVATLIPDGPQTPRRRGSN